MPRLKLLKKAAFYRCRCRVRVLLSPQCAAEHSLRAFNCAAVHRGAGGHFGSAARKDGGGRVEDALLPFPKYNVFLAEKVCCRKYHAAEDHRGIILQPLGIWGKQYADKRTRKPVGECVTGGNTQNEQYRFLCAHAF